jgi:hypothetical protein
MYRRPSALAALRLLRRVPFSRSASAAALRGRISGSVSPAAVVCLFAVTDRRPLDLP